MDEILKCMPAGVVEAVRQHGFHKLAAQMYGVPEITEKVAAQIIGQRLMQRQAEWHEVNQGLAALEDLLG